MNRTDHGGRVRLNERLGVGRLNVGSKVRKELKTMEAELEKFPEACQQIKPSIGRLWALAHGIDELEKRIRFGDEYKHA